MRNRIAQFVKSDGVGLGLLYGVLTIVALPFMLLSFANGYLAVTAVAGAYLLLTGCLVVLGTLLVVLGYTLRPIVCWIWR